MGQDEVQRRGNEETGTGHSSVNTQQPKTMAVAGDESSAVLLAR